MNLRDRLQQRIRDGRLTASSPCPESQRLRFPERHDDAPRLGIRLYRDNASQALLRTDPRMTDRCLPEHAGCLWRVRIKLIALDDADPIVSPAVGGVFVAVVVVGDEFLPDDFGSPVSLSRLHEASWRLKLQGPGRED